MEPTLGRDDVLQALQAADAFWRAVGVDDDRVVEGLLMPNAVLAMGSGAGLSGRLRERMGQSASDCLRMGYFSRFELLPGDELRVFYTAADEFREVAPYTQLSGRWLELGRFDGRWLVDPVRPHTIKAIGYATVEGHQDTPALPN